MNLKILISLFRSDETPGRIEAHGRTSQSRNAET